MKRKRTTASKNNREIKTITISTRSKKNKTTLTRTQRTITKKDKIDEKNN